MNLLSNVKKASINLGLYPTMRWVERRVVRPTNGKQHEEDIQLFEHLIPGNSLCFDVGANVGKKSEALLAAGKRVVSFEPNPLVIPELQARCKNYNDWKLVSCGLGSGPSILELYARQSHGQSGFVVGWTDKTIATFNVPVVTLDAAILAFGKPYYIKIDVEGWESEVLSGLSHAIPLISFEFHLVEQKRSDTISCLKKLAKLGESTVNLCAAEGTRFLFDDWMPLGQFMEWFPGDLDIRMPNTYYGDIYVKNENT